ncbi:hypothetical protein [Winogradskyella vidalii]|uniref:hypothetical protein n=1 Tax=Winogradskyella vidalii TaxID=2615024 RepID=UPI0015CEB202|nr:hypothetical protein [Winogradskyella vidalii]
MKQRHKKIGIIIVVIIVFIAILTFVANYFIEQKIKTTIDDLPESVKIDYAEVDAAVWRGNIKLLSPTITVTGETTNKIILDAKLKAIEINDVGYWDFIFNDKIAIEALVVNELVAKYKHNSVVKNDDYQSSFLDKIKQIVYAEKITINQADILITNYDTDSLILSVPKFNFEVEEFQIDPKAKALNKKIGYNDFALYAENLKWATNEYDDLVVDSMEVTKHQATFKDFKLQTKYSRPEYSARLKKERDHFNLKIKELRLSDMDFGFNKAEQFYFKSKNVLLNSPDAEIYRDKLVADDTSYKLLYGTMLRNLGFELGLNSVEIFEGQIAYLEKVNADKPAGRIAFTAMNATISNFGNNYGDEKMAINVKTTFMENSALEVDWSFKVADTTDQFVFKADLGTLKAQQMNQFTQPNLNVDLNGELKQTYFNISATPISGRIDLKMKYDDFEISILKKNGEEKNKFLSGLANLFVSKDSEEDKKNYRYGEAENVERDVTKSVFNFVWLHIKDGLLSVMTGDGDK